MPRLIGKLTQAQLQMFEENRSCKQACKELVTEAIAHYEKSVRLDWLFWKALKDRYAEHLTVQEKGRISLNHDTGEVTMLTEEEFAMQKIDQRWEDEKAFMDKFRELGE